VSQQPLKVVPLVLSLALPLACHRSERSAGTEAPSASPSRGLPLDHLGPGELAPGEDALFGLKLPRGMQVQGKFSDSALAVGTLDLQALAEYVRTRVTAANVEVGATRIVFPSARIPGSPPDRVYRIEVVRQGSATRLSVRDVTPAPRRVPDGLDDAERWKRAGFSPDGKPLNMKALE
jgi:hypothetical protein